MTQQVLNTNDPYLKEISRGSASVSLAAIPSGGGSVTGSTTINHNLGFVPNFTIFMEFTSDNLRLPVYSAGSFFSTAYATTTDLVIIATNSALSSRPAVTYDYTYIIQTPNS